jgi:hypothetical protein
LLKSHATGHDAIALEPYRDEPPELAVTVLAVVPDPPPEADLWLQELAKDSDATATWGGLGFVEQLAAKFPDVIDYYLNGAAARIREAQAKLLALMGLDNVGTATSTQEVAERMQRVLRVLDHDPHSRFEFRFGEVLDTYSRRVVGWSIDASPTGALVTDALGIAIGAQLGKRPEPGTIIHSDHESVPSVARRRGHPRRP